MLSHCFNALTVALRLKIERNFHLWGRERFDEWVFAVRFEPTGQLNITCSRSLVKLSYADASQHQSWKLLTDSSRVEITKKVYYEQFLFLFFIAVARRVSLFIVEEKMSSGRAGASQWSNSFPTEQISENCDLIASETLACAALTEKSAR